MSAGVATTLGELKSSGYTPSRGVRQELRDNVLARLARGEALLDGLAGYQETVLPTLATALVAGHDTVLLGERGQAKSRIARQLATLLDPLVPAVEGCEIHDNPFFPVCAFCREKAETLGDALPVVWITPEERYVEKLATPDTTVADLVGEIDPIRVAEGRYLADEKTIHFGLLPRANRGIFVINELPELAERLQVALLSAMEERDIQIRGHVIRLPLDLFVVATANPEDYTNRGRIITPLKDRFGTQVRTHYPADTVAELAVVEKEAAVPPLPAVTVPPYVAKIVAELTRLARLDSRINQKSGVSVRFTIDNYETVCANAVRRAAIQQEESPAVRICDIWALRSSMAGKLELDGWQAEGEDAVMDTLVDSAIFSVFQQMIPESEWDRLLAPFVSASLAIECGEQIPPGTYMESAALLDNPQGWLPPFAGRQMSAGEVSAMVEFLLEGLYLARKLSRATVSSGSTYRR